MIKPTTYNGGFCVFPTTKTVHIFTEWSTYLDPINSNVPAMFWIGGIPARIFS